MISKEKPKRKNRLREAIRAAVKPAAAEAEKNSPEVSPDEIRELRRLVKGQVRRLMAELASPTTTLTAVKAKLKDMASAWANYKGKYDRLCETFGREQGQDLRSLHDALNDEQTEALGYALGAIHRLGRSAPNEEGHRDASDDDNAGGE